MYICIVPSHVHVTKNVAKEIKKITMGPNKSEGIKWWRELADKRWCTNNVIRTCTYTVHVRMYVQT